MLTITITFQTNEETLTVEKRYGTMTILQSVSPADAILERAEQAADQLIKAMNK